ncbi:MAG: CzcABC family efflux RND transporter, transmembrane protein [Nitrospira sp.]|jgi:multidrug efflux pump subunit AcrB|nr:CzcABC family efflux RND transporter, transmembrane protein [Nitrospira sp.]
MWMVFSALRRPVTVLVVIVAVALCAVLALSSMPIDIFPDLGLPAIYVIQPYGGMAPSQMEAYLVSFYEYHVLYILGIEHVESKSIQGAALIKLFFYPGTDMNQALAQTIAYVDRSRAFMPPGTLPPDIIRYDAGGAPVGYLVFHSETRNAGEVQDLALFRVRPLFATLPGVSAPPPFGGNARTVVIHVDPERLRAYQMSPEEVVQAVNKGNVITPAGNVRIHNLMTITALNAVVSDIQQFRDLPIRTGAGPTVYLRDVGWVENGSDILTGYALFNGRRAIYIPVTKRADASTLAVINRVKEALPRFKAVIPDDIDISLEFDQSAIVTNTIKALAIEIMLGSLLTGLMVLIFLRSWKSSLIVLLTIPCALLGSIVALWVTGQTINIMTLGGLALSVGVLVDASTVAIESIHAHLGKEASAARAVIDSAVETIVPRFVSMLAVLAVFIPSFFMTGVGRALFVPLALAVGFAMMASYILSSTFVSIMAVWLLGRRRPPEERDGMFERVKLGYGRCLQILLPHHRLMFIGYTTVVVIVILVVGQYLGTELFPTADTGQFQVRLRAPDGTRIERTEVLAKEVLAEIEEEAGPDNVGVTLGYVGTVGSSYPVNLLHLWTSGPHEAVLRIALKRDAGISVEDLKDRLRRTLPERLPGTNYSFEAGDLVSQVLSLGSPTPIEIAVTSPNLDANMAVAHELMGKLRAVPTLRDLQFGQPLEYPTVEVDLDRFRAGQLGVTTEDVARSLVAATSSSRFVQRMYWADPSSGVAYQIQIEVPQVQMAGLEDVRNIPVMTPVNGNPWVYVRDVATVTQGTMLGEYDRHNMQRMITITANVAGEDLARAADRVTKTIAALGQLPKGVTVTLRGQVGPMRETLAGLRTGLLLTMVVILLLLVGSFQSWRNAGIVLSTLPAALAGVLVMLFLTRTTVNVQSFLGAIMAMGIAVANAILLVSFADTRWRAGCSATAAAVDGACERLRPILMTSLAMVVGMIPMALGLGEGGEQTAPLGRAVIGGLVAATLSSLLVVPAVFALAHGERRARTASLLPEASMSPAEQETPCVSVEQDHP